MDYHAGGKWFIHGPKRRKENQLLSLKHPCWLSLIYHVNEAHGNMFSPLFENMVYRSMLQATLCYTDLCYKLPYSLPSLYT